MFSIAVMFQGRKQDVRGFLHVIGVSTDTMEADQLRFD